MRVELRFEREIITFKCFEVNAQGAGFSQGVARERCLKGDEGSRVGLSHLKGRGRCMRH